jgi:DNA-binding NtrC family response regulator
VETGEFRKDLYFRLNVFTLNLPALREHKDDIPQLVQHFVDSSNQKHFTVVSGIHPEALQLLLDYSWPGNVRELRNVIERAVILCRESYIRAVHLPPQICSPHSHRASPVVLYPGVSMAKAEELLILQTLKNTGNNKAEAARQLGVDVKTLRHKLKSYGVY